MAFPADTQIQNIESIQERDTAAEENSPKFPIGRRDFDCKYIFISHQKKDSILLNYNAKMCTGQEEFINISRDRK